MFGDLAHKLSEPDFRVWLGLPVSWSASKRGRSCHLACVCVCENKGFSLLPRKALSLSLARSLSGGLR